MKLKNEGPGTVTATPSSGSVLTCNPSTTCDWTFATGVTVTLTGSANTGNYFNGFFGQCSGTAPCVLSGNADKYVVAYFSASPEVHANWTGAGHKLPGTAFKNKTPGYLDCTTCHGASLQGVGLAPSCTGCHHKGGVTLRGFDGNPLAVGSAAAYSPEKTCGGATTGCHDVAKISSAYHFQQGYTKLAALAPTPENPAPNKDCYNTIKPWLLTDGMYGKW